MVKFSMDMFVKSYQPEQYEFWKKSQKEEKKSSKGEKGRIDGKRAKNGKYKKLYKGSKINSIQISNLSEIPS